MRKSLRSKQHEQLVELLTEARKSARLTQAQVAARLDRPQSFVAKYENGERRIDVVEFLAIAAALKADPVLILKRVATAAR
jgi:transcriptional regulator with XRE-family HTH domain